MKKERKNLSAAIRKKLRKNVLYKMKVEKKKRQQPAVGVGAKKNKIMLIIIINIVVNITRSFDSAAVMTWSC